MSILGDCVYGAWQLPSGKMICLTLVPYRRSFTFTVTQQFCSEIGFDRLFEPRALEDAKHSALLGKCK